MNYDSIARLLLQVADMGRRGQLTIDEQQELSAQLWEVATRRDMRDDVTDELVRLGAPVEVWS